MSMETNTGGQGFDFKNQVESSQDYYQKSQESAEAGKHQEALSYIQKHLSVAPDDAEALNDAGVLLHCLGRSDEAITHLIRARALKGNCAEIVWNLAEAYVAAGKAKEAMQLFDEMDQADMLNPDMFNRAATILLDQGDKANAIEVLLRSQQMWPQQKVLKPMIDVIRYKRPKVAFFCGADGMTFLNEILEFTENRFNVKVFEGETEEQLQELMEWSDISWFEWCTDLAIIASNMPKVCKNIIRLHRYEAYGPWPQQVNWANIDNLITVGNNITKQTLFEKMPHLESQTSMIDIPNGVNLDKFKFSDRGRGKNIAFLGNLRMVKNPTLVLQGMQKLHYIDPEYRLFFGGAFQDQVLEQYLKHMVKTLDLTDVVFFDGWQKDVNSWLQDKHYVVSTSVCEGHPVGILEAMACGLKPVIHNFLGAENIFPSEFLFNISEEFCEQILSDDYEPDRYRKFVEEKYSLRDQLLRVNNVFTRFEAEMDLNQIQPLEFDKVPLGITTEKNISSEYPSLTFANEDTDRRNNLQF